MTANRLMLTLARQRSSFPQGFLLLFPPKPSSFTFHPLFHPSSFSAPFVETIFRLLNPFLQIFVFVSVHLTCGIGFITLQKHETLGHLL
jgi:hypothetical protein